MDESRSRVRVFTALILVIFAILALRLVKLQLIDRQSHTGASQDNSMREHRVQAPRGRFFDRNGVLMVENEPTYSIFITPQYFEEETIPLLAELLSVADTTMTRQVQDAKKWSMHKRTLLRSGVSVEELGLILEQRHRLHGIDFDLTQKRRYLTQARATHALGYVREISDKTLHKRVEEGYRRGDAIGKAGLELEYESAVRGRVGAEYKMVNVKGQVVEDYLGGERNHAPVSGNELNLTLDADLQAFAESLFVGKRGGVIALDPNNGEVLAMHSAPDYNLEMFTGYLDAEVWDEVVSAPEKPLFNRVTQSVFMPGSTFKPLVALLALHAGAIDAKTKVYCGGGHPRGRGQFFACLDTHGSINVVEAIKESCNTFFFEMMRIMDVNSLNRFATSLGFGSSPSLDIAAGEIADGRIPDSTYFNSRFGPAPQFWNEGTTMNLGVGQGDLLVSPLQLARYMAALSNGGKLVSPHLVREIVNLETQEVVRPNDQMVEQVALNPVYVRLVKEGMARVVSEESDWLQIPGIDSYGKTGSAENSRADGDDSVFILAAPAQNPTIVLAVLVENAGFGSTAAGPIGSFMAERYLTGRIDPKRNWLMNLMFEKNSAPMVAKSE
ncbi:MAG: penicillin-binding protein 2 [Rhodothermales bacterium]|nr:penicillin-binding protein 2 [Rhodothermales bacterium]MDG2016820.1 penicillin-binding protein 2 [Rhodothermales bacterium]HAY35980.1 penicillin-binding protein 2 [Bacteroidota bacterium]